jgi:hypothetical protein
VNFSARFLDLTSRQHFENPSLAFPSPSRLNHPPPACNPAPSVATQHTITPRYLFCSHSTTLLATSYPTFTFYIIDQHTRPIPAVALDTSAPTSPGVEATNPLDPRSRRVIQHIIPQCRPICPRALHQLQLVRTPIELRVGQELEATGTLDSPPLKIHPRMPECHHVALCELGPAF